MTTISAWGGKAMPESTFCSSIETSSLVGRCFRRADLSDVDTDKFTSEICDPTGDLGGVGVFNGGVVQEGGSRDF